MGKGTDIIRNNPRVFDLLRKKNVAYEVDAITQDIMITKPNEPRESYSINDIEELENQLKHTYSLEKVSNERSLKWM